MDAYWYEPVCYNRRVMTTAAFSQADFAVRCEWGAAGIAQLAPVSDVIVVVDVLSFSTSVDIAVSNGATVYPYRWQDASAAAYAASVGALVAGDRSAQVGFSLAPSSLRTIRAGTRLVLPSPNGATLSLTTGAVATIAGCLRNAAAVARVCERLGRRVSVIPAGERWPDGSLRPAIEDLIGAGAIIAQLAGMRSPEAEVARQAFLQAQPDLAWYLAQCGSGRELAVRGYADDLALAAALNQSTTVPLFRDGAYISYSDGDEQCRSACT
jgi:2-phosphosulfolactate phosphatase